ncbi:MAG: archaeal proteasome endopeptidase complex subunit alpha [Candidatus Aenigmatarchaeota archaeon]
MGMMMPGGGGGKMGYDRAIVTFSPDGRLFQVEYAREAVKRATTAVGIKYDDGVILAGMRRIDKLSTEEGSKKIHQIDENIGIASAGVTADARVLVDKARVNAQVYRISYEEPIDVKSLAEEMGDFKQQHTQYGGLRPMGVSFLIAGYDEEARLFETDVGGAVYGWNAQVIGRGREGARELLKNEWDEEMDEDDAIDLAVRCLEKGEEEMDKDNIKIAVMDKDGYRELTKDEIKELL